MQSAESMNSESIISKNFTMVHGGITAYGSSGSIVGVSQVVPQVNGLLSFLLLAHGAATPPPAEVYCELVSFESFGFHVTGSGS